MSKQKIDPAAATTIEELMRIVARQHEEAYRNVQRRPPDLRPRTAFDERKYLAQLQEVEVFVDLQGKRTLNVGSGPGGVEVLCLQRGYTCFGVEPDSTLCKVAQQWLRLAGFGGHHVVLAPGQALPFASESIDAVVSFHVLEHVDDVQQTFAEMWRVLKPGGALYLTTPNYLVPWELHYGIPWLPLMPRTLARAYLRVLGRNPGFLDHLEYITPMRLARFFESYGARYLDVGLAEAPQQVRQLEPQVKSQVLGHVLRLLRRIHGLFILETFSRLGLHPFCKMVGWKDRGENPNPKVPDL